MGRAISFVCWRVAVMSARICVECFSSCSFQVLVCHIAVSPLIQEAFIGQ